MAENFNGFKGHFEAAKKTFSLAGEGDIEEGIKKLEGDTIKETNENFVNATRELWKDFTVHGIIENNQLKSKTDLDGKAATGLLKLIGMDVHKLKYVTPGDYTEGAINLDTGRKGGVQYEDETKTAFFDHHLENKNPEHISATDLVYKTIVKLDLLKNSKYLNEELPELKKKGLIKDPDHLRKLVEFVNRIDNKNFPDQEKYYKDSYNNMLGLSRFVTFPKLLQFFQDGRTPIEKLNMDDLVKYGFKYKEGNKLVNRQQERKSAVTSSLEGLAEIEKDGYIVKSNKYGEIIIDRDGKVRDGADAAYSHNNCSVYIKWKNTGFFISSKIPFDNSFVLSQGIKVRDTMYLKPDDGQPLNIDLGEVLDKLEAEY